MKITSLLAITSIAITFGAVTPVFAGSLLAGSTIDIQYVIANDTGVSPLQDPGGYEIATEFGTAVVPTGVAFNGLRFGIFDVSVNDTTETITDTNNNVSFCCSPFAQGLLMTVEGGPAIGDVIFDSASTIGNASDVDFTSNQVFYQVNDLSFVTGSAVLDLVSVAPEPGTVFGALTGLGLIIGLRRQRKFQTN